MMESIAYYSAGEWRLLRFHSPAGPDLTHASSYRTLLYGLILRAVYDHRNSAVGTRIHVPHPSLLARLLRTTKTRLTNITQLALLQRIHALAGPNISFHLCLPLSRLAKYKAFRTGGRRTRAPPQEPSPRSPFPPSFPQTLKGTNGFHFAAALGSLKWPQ